MRLPMLAVALLLVGPLAVGAQDVAEPTGEPTAGGYAAAKAGLAEQRVARLRAQLEEARRLQAEGAASDTALAEVEARLALARAELAHIRDQLKPAPDD